MSNPVSARYGVRAALLCGACMVAMGASPALAQQAAANEAETVTVTGIIGSLQRNLDIKRDAPGVVDAISAEDIGTFPDSDLAASMERIPGVTVTRGTSSLGGVPTSTGTATEVTVRGFGPSFNETLYDGRKMSSGTGRAFDFSSVSSDFVNEIDVLKSPDASLSSGAIGATINIKFPKPLDNPGFHLVGSVSGNYSPDDGRPTPNGDFLISDTFDHDTFGILVDAAYTQSRTSANHVNIQGWEGTHIQGSQLATPTAATDINGFYIQDYGIYQEHTNDTRLDGRLALQWRPVDSVTVTLNDDFSRDTLNQIQYGYSVWFNAGSLTNVVQDGHGTLTSFSQPNTPTDFQSQINGSVLQNNLTGVNVKWDASDKLSFTADAASAISWLNPGGQLSSIDADVGYGPSQPGGTNASNVGIAGVGSLPYLTGYGPNGNAANFLGTGIIGSHVLPISQPNRTDKVQQAKLEATWKENDNLSVTFGYQFVGDHDNAKSYDDFANNDWQAYSGYGTASNNYYPVDTVAHPSPNCLPTTNNGNPCPAGATLPQNLFTNSFKTSGFISGKDSSHLPPQILQFNALAVRNYLQSLGNPQSQYVPGANTTCCAPAFNGIYSTALNAGSYEQIIENSNSLYLNVQSKTQIGGMPLQINFGLREDSTDLTAIGLGQQPTSLTVQAADHTAFLVGYGTQSYITGTNSYQYLLPNLDLKLGVTDDIQVRFDASRTLTRPPLGDISPVLNVGQGQRVGSLVATGNNPNLMPYLSDNLDLGVEWYYAANSYISLDGFTKNVTNFVVQGSRTQTINGVMDPTTNALGQFTVSSYINGPTANVYGAEVAWQYVFGDSGYGFQVNGTVVGTNKPYDPSNLTISDFAVTGLADSANLVAFYDKDGFQARVAINWQDSYLDHFGQAQNNSAFGTEPTFVNANTHIDFSTSYDITSQFNVYFEGLNLTDATYSTHGRYSNQLLDIVDYGRRFTLGVHYKL